MRRGLAALVVVFAGCGSDIQPPPRLFDGGGLFRPDAWRDPRDAFAFPDTGPPGPIVVPRQSWTTRATLGDETITITIALDARAETGVVRGVAGANGRSVPLEIEAPGDGALYVRGMVPVGPVLRDCRGTTHWIDQLVLHFVDADGDGVRETLQSVTSHADVLLSSYAAPTLVDLGALPGFGPPTPDTAPPTLSLAHPVIVGGYEVVVLSASEPMEPTFVPRLAGPASASFRPDPSNIMSSLWTLDTRRLPLGHYELDLASGTDYAGIAPVVPSGPALDVVARTLPAIDGIGEGITAIGALTPMTILGDDPGEPSFVGTSLLTTSRTVISFDATSGNRALQLLIQLHSTTEVALGTTASLQIYDGTGLLVADVALPIPSMVTSVLPGFARESAITAVTLPFHAATSGSYYAVLVPGGDGAPTCDQVSDPAPIGVVLDQITIE